VARHYRDGAGAWQYEELTEGDVPIPCPETALALDAIYAGVEREGDEYWPRPRRVREAEPTA
jgi:hypothetical protein